MSNIDYLIIVFVIHLLLDTISFCKQSDRISELEWKLRELKEKKDGADND